MDILNQLNDYMKTMRLDYAICGGGAIDLFVGHQTRPHKDLDVAVYWEDRDTIVQYMLDNAWDVYEPCGTEHLHKINAATDQKRVKTNIWCVRPDTPHYSFTKHENNMFAVDFDGKKQTDLGFIEFLFNKRRDDFFLYARNESIKLSMNHAVLKTEGIPFLAPELVLLYKSTAVHNPEYQLDFNNAMPKMDKMQKMWLEEALNGMFPAGHKWLESRLFSESLES